MAGKALLTVEEFLRLPESAGDRDGRYELVEGEAVEIGPEMLLHNLVRDCVLIALLDYVEAQKCDTVVGIQHFHLFGNTVRRLDVSFVRAGRELPLHTLPQGAPDLAVEVVSPSNTPREIDQRIGDYFAAGCQRVWVAYYDEREVHIHGLAGVTRLSGDDLLEDAELLPGFSLKVLELFA